MMARSQAHEQNGLKKGPWIREEDQKLIEYMKRHNEREQWRDVPRLAGLNRCGKSCRLRWTNYLRPDIKRGDFSLDEEAIIIRLQSVHGNKWAFISTHLPGRTDNEIKNYWNTYLKKKLLAKETPLVTQTPSQQLLATANSLASTANYLRSYALKLNSDAQLPNLHLLHNPVLQGFGYVTLNPQSQLHGLGFDSTDPQDLPSTLPPQGTSFNYQAMEHPIPQLNNNHGVNFINMSTDPAQTRPSLPPQGPSVNYEAMEDPTVHNFRDHFGPFIAKTPNTGLISDLQVNNNHAADLGFLFGNVPHAGSIPASMVSAPSEFSMTNQVEKEITPAEQISIPLSTSTTFEACWTELVDSPESSMTNQVENEITSPAEQISIPLSTSTTFEACWTELMDSPEFSMTNQVENEITPPAEQISIPLSTSTTFEACWTELMDSPEFPMTNQVENEITPPAEQISIPLSTSTTFEACWSELMDSPELYMTNQVEKEITPAEEISIPLFTSTTFEACWPELLMDSPEFCMTNQVENEITPPAEEISNPFSTLTWPDLLMDNETTDSLCGDIALE